MSNKVVKLVLGNADTGKDLFDLSDGQVIDLRSLPTRRLYVRAVTSPEQVGSVKFIENNRVGHTETSAPYSMRQDEGPGKFNPWTPPPGGYVITATPYDKPQGQGVAGGPLTVRLAFLDGAPQPAGTLSFPFDYPNVERIEVRDAKGNLCAAPLKVTLIYKK